MSTWEIIILLGPLIAVFIGILLGAITLICFFDRVYGLEKRKEKK